MDKETLLQQCEQLNHNQRMKRMIELGRNSIDNASDKNLIQELLEGSVYEQMLGLQTCHGSRDVKPALQALASPSRLLKVRALPFVPLLATDEEALDAFKLIPRHSQLGFFRRLRKTPRVAAIDTYLTRLGTSKVDQEEFRRMFPYGSEQMVKNRLPSNPEHISYENWARLIRFHPEVACLAIHEWAERTKSIDVALVRVVNELLRQRALPESLWDTIYDIARLMLKSNPTEEISLSRIYRKRSQAFDKLAFDIYEREPFSLDWKGANKLPTELLLELLQRYPTLQIKIDFGSLRVEKRLALYKTLPQSWRGEDGALSENVIGALPSEQRVHEARKHLRLRPYETYPHDRAFSIAYLPWEEAMPAQNELIRSNDASTRAFALRCQIDAAKYQHSHYGDALQLVIQRKFEQDPVREPMLGALSRLPPTHWKEEHLPGLATVIRDALDASDLSYTSQRRLVALVIPILSVYPSWAAPQLASILREREEIPWTIQLSGKTPIKETLRITAKALLPVLKLWQEQGKKVEMSLLAEAFDSNIRHFPGILDMMEQNLKDTRDRSRAESVLKIIRKYFPHRLDTLIPQLLELDPSYMVIETVYEHIHRHHQTLVTPYLDSNAPKGCFVDGKRNELHWISDCYYRWTLKQHERLGETLSGMIRDKERPTLEPTMRLKQLESLCFLDASYLIPFTNHERPPVAETALRALSRLDSEQGIPTLLEALHTDKARIAISALRRVFKTMPKSTVLELLKNAPWDKVTVAKEIIRSIGELKTDEAYQYLLEKDKSNLHVDARIALLKALWSYPERAETWEILKKAAQDPKPPMPKALADIPAASFSPQQHESLVEVFDLLLSHSSAEVRDDTLKRCRHNPPSDTSQRLSPRLLTLLESPVEDEPEAAIMALYETYEETHPSLIAHAIKLILPNRKLLSRICPNLSRQLEMHRQHTFPITLSIIRVLETDPLTLKFRLQYVFQTLPWSKFRSEFSKLTPLLHADALVACEKLIEQELGSRVDARLDELESEFGASTDERLRRLGLAALVALSKKREGWTEEMRTKLETYQKDESLLVREAAVFVFPPVRDSDSVSEEKST